MNGLRVRWETLAFWAMLTAFLVLAEVVRQRPEPSNFGAYETSALGGQHTGVYRYRPVDYLFPAGMSIPAPHPRAHEADRLLLDGQVLAAASLLEEVLAEQPADAYSRLMAACVWTESGQLRRAQEHAAELIARAEGVRTAQLLWHYLDDQARRPTQSRPASYLHALVEVCTDPRLVTPVHADLLQDLVEDRILTANPSRLPDPPADPLAARAFALLRPGTPRERLWACLEEGGPVALQLLAMNLLGLPGNEEESYRMLDAIERLTIQEPRNPYWDYLTAEVATSQYRAVGNGPDGWPLDHGFPDASIATRALQDSLRKPDFDPHVTAVHQLAVTAQRRAHIAFPEQHVPPPRTFLFLGDFTFPGRLANQALHGQTDGPNGQQWTLLNAAARLLTWQPQLCQNPFGGEDISAHYRERFLAHPLVEEQASEFLPRMREWRPLPTVPPRLRMLQRYLLHPLPIPSLVEDLDLRYAGQLDLLAKDLQLAWNRR